MRGLPPVNEKPDFFFFRHESAFADQREAPESPFLFSERLFNSPNLPQPPYRPASIRTLVFAGAVWGPQFTPGAAISRLELAACSSQTVVQPPMFAVTRTRRFCNQKSALNTQAATVSGS
jgi:hypothetical protein